MDAPDQRLASIRARHVKMTRYFRALALTASTADLMMMSLRLAAHYERLSKAGVPGAVAREGHTMSETRGVYMPGLAPGDPIDRPTELRARAARARNYAQFLINDSASPRLLAYADELDALAKAADGAIGSTSVVARCHGGL